MQPRPKTSLYTQCHEKGNAILRKEKRAGKEKKTTVAINVQMIKKVVRRVKVSEAVCSDKCPATDGAKLYVTTRVISAKQREGASYKILHSAETRHDLLM